MNIYVGNLSYDTTDQELQAAFEQYGSVSEARIATDKYTGKSRGFGFVEMANNAEARQAIEGLNGRDFGGRTLNVNEARPREDRGPRRERSSRWQPKPSSTGSTSAPRTRSRRNAPSSLPWRRLGFVSSTTAIATGGTMRVGCRRR